MRPKPDRIGRNQRAVRRGSHYRWSPADDTGDSPNSSIGQALSLVSCQALDMIEAAQGRLRRKAQPVLLLLA
jgi:hypothetical protein